MRFEGNFQYSVSIFSRSLSSIPSIACRMVYSTIRQALVVYSINCLSDGLQYHPTGACRLFHQLLVGWPPIPSDRRLSARTAAADRPLSVNNRGSRQVLVGCEPYTQGKRCRVLTILDNREAPRVREPDSPLPLMVMPTSPRDVVP